MVIDNLALITWVVGLVVLCTLIVIWELAFWNAETFAQANEATTRESHISLFTSFYSIVGGWWLTKRKEQRTKK